MSTPRTLPRTEWRSFFDALSTALTGQPAEVEVASLDLGDQVVAEWLPMVGITYESHDDLLDVALQGPDHYDHLIRHPKEIVVVSGPEGVTSVAVATADDVREVIRFKEAVALPGAGAGA